MVITLPADGWVRNFLGSCEPECFIAWDLIKYLGPSHEAKLHLLLQDECESIHDWHCTLPDDLD